MQMPYRLVIIDEASSDGGARLDWCRDDAYRCRRLSWRDLSAREPAVGDADLIVADASVLAPCVKAALEWMGSARLSAPLLTLLPSDVDESTLNLATRVSDDFVILPARPFEMHLRMRRMLASRTDEEVVCERLIAELASARLVGRSAAFLRAIEQVPRFARTDMPVLVTGETGTGKELCARALHLLGPRRGHPFVAVDCGSIPEALMENELFGHVRGAFTGADRESKGLCALADGGTLFLDEIDALSLAAQAKLLRFLQERTFRPLGSERVLSGNVKVVAATNRDLVQSVREGLFRSDLYFRLNILHVHLPPLRERRGDVELLACDLLERASATLGEGAKAFTRAALHALEEHDWPGNVRELGNVVQRAAVTCDGEWISPSHLALERAAFASAPSAALQIMETGGNFRAARAATLAAFERRYVEELLRKHRGNVTQAAREAEQDRRAFGRFIKKYGIDRTAL
jgi:DNA-binding NtrC family response regulator